jgi:hypothetical protein
MTSTTQRYSAAASQANGTAKKIADTWTNGAQTLSDHMPPSLPQFNLIPAVELYFELVHRTVDMSRYLTIKWVQAAGTLVGVVREQADSVGGVVREQAESTRDLVYRQANKVEQTARKQAEKAEQAQRELAREERKAEREQARHAHDKARERYEGRTKAELSDLLGERDLPKTGNVDELIERLVEADSK